MTAITTPGSEAVSPLHVLQHKKAAELSDGAFTRYEPIDPSDRSRYSPSSALTRVELGLGYVQAVLAALHGVVTVLTYDPPGLCGRVETHSTGGSTLYRFTWRDGPDGLLLGGFGHSGGKPTYQAALVALVQAVALFRSGHREQSAELVERWFALVQAMERAFPRRDHSAGWDRRSVALACTTTATRPHIMRVCDALRIALSFRLPDLPDRNAAVLAADPLERGIGASIIVPGALLLNPDEIAHAPVPTPEPALSPTPPAPAAGTPASSTTAPAPSAGTSAPSPVEPPDLRLFGAQVTRIELALRRGGPLMLVGPTATGKTTQAMAAALRLGFGVEAVTLDEGWEAEDLFGSYTRTRRDREWSFVAGPVTRWAERAANGEQVLLLIDELARGHKTVVSAVMRLMNEHTRSAIEGMKLALPADEAGPFYIVDIRATQQRIVLPCRRVRIVATANQGEGYSGIDLSDPAFGRRWTGGWLQLSSYPPDEAARIIGDRLGLAPAAPLIKAMQQVELQVLAYQKKEEALRATLDLATLIAWGRTALYLHAHATTAAKGNARLAFQDAARDTWLDRLCPLQGADLDPQVERVLLDMVSTAAPAKLK